ncbi:MAG: hypothetical protein QQN63_01580 [Nitrosopumilus sp.]
MSGKVAELQNIIDPHGMAQAVVRMWDNFRTQRQPWVEENLELRNFIFATDTSKTTNNTLPWKNSTTLPKLTQIRDNLHANYMAALFPNDQWLKWEGYTLDDELVEKKEAIQAYMENKTRESGFMNTISQALYDYIDYGNAFVDSIWVNETMEDPETGEIIHGYVGPKAIRISPLDMMINPTASTFKDSPKITRSILTIGEIIKMAEEDPSKEYLREAMKKSEKIRSAIDSFSVEDFDKAVGYSIDGFGDLKEYYQSPFVEILELEGDIRDTETNEYKSNRIITIIDRSILARDEQIPSWLGKGSKAHVAWRLRPDNLYGMGPLHNLVGMQYRIDHLENLKADVFDLIAYPPLMIIGEVEQFNWAPGEEIHIDEGGDVKMLTPDTTALNADTQIEILERKMEEFAGAPKEAMGIRSPGEKTAFEVQSLQNAAGRIFQEKVTNFEINCLEPLLNSMLEVARRNLNTGDVLRVMDDDLGVTRFLSITKEDITATGKLRPIGARHFAARAQLVQNLTGLFNSPISQLVTPHISGKKLSRLFEDVLGLSRFQLFQDNVAVFEQIETQQLMNQAQEEVELQDSIAAEPLEEEDENII